MKEFKGTKGPWQLDELPNWVKGKDGVGDVCRVSNHSGYEELRGSDLANANLIVAAPELLKALQAAIKELEQYIPVTDVRVLDTAYAAINKALTPCQ